MVGLNFEGLDRVSYLIDGEFEAIKKVIDYCLHDVHHFSKKQDKNNLIYTKQDSVNRATVIFALGRDSKQNKTILASVAFKSSLFAIERSELALEVRKSFVYNLSKRLENIQSTLSKIDSLDDPLSELAYARAIAPTRPKTEIIQESFRVFRGLDKYYKFVIIVTLLAIAVMTVLLWLNIGGFDSNTYIELIGFFLIALLFELGFPLHQERSRRKEEKSDLR